MHLVLPLHQPLRFPHLSMMQSGDDKATRKIATDSELWDEPLSRNFVKDIGTYGAWGGVVVKALRY